jgi:hypothetical protein
MLGGLLRAAPGRAPVPRRTRIVDLVGIPDGGDDVFEQMERRPGSEVGPELGAR